MGNWFSSLPGAIAQGLIWGIMAIGVYITYRILDIADEIVVIANGQISMQGPKDDILPHLLGTASAVDACTKFYNKEEA